MRWPMAPRSRPAASRAWFTLGGVNNALRVAGTVNGATIETLALWNTPNFVLNTLAGSDVITTSTITTTLGINNITINAGDDADTININGVLTASASVAVNGNNGDDTFIFANPGQVVGPTLDIAGLLIEARLKPAA